MRKDVGRANVLYVHVTLLPELAATGELKTKPTQHSVKELRGIGIQPDVIVLRSDRPVSDEIREKIALFTDVATEAVIPAETADSIYEVPLLFEEAGLGRLIVRDLGSATPRPSPDLDGWRALVERIKAPKPTLEIGLVGKYIELPDAYLSVTEALKHAAWAHGVDAKVRWVDSEALTKENLHEALDGVAGVLVPGGFGHRGIEGKVLAAHYARDHKIPYLGLCLGLQCAVIEFARDVIGTSDANSTEFDMFTENPVIDFMPDQRDMEDKGGTMRLGLYPARLTPGSKAAAVYGQEVIYERHRHRFEVNNRYRQTLEGAGMLLSGQSPGRPARRDRRAEGPPVVRGQPVPPRVQVAAGAAAPAVRRVRGGVDRGGRRARAGARGTTRERPYARPRREAGDGADAAARRRSAASRLGTAHGDSRRSAVAIVVTCCRSRRSAIDWALGRACRSAGARSRSPTSSARSAGSHDFDGCFRPEDEATPRRDPRPRGRRRRVIDMPISLLQVDHAYFVEDGHKRLSVAIADGRRVVDADVDRFETDLHVAPGTTMASIRVTARERRFRKVTGLEAAFPRKRFPLSDPDGYLELEESVKAHTLDFSRSRRPPGVARGGRPSLVRDGLRAGPRDRSSRPAPAGSSSRRPTPTASSSSGVGSTCRWLGLADPAGGRRAWPAERDRKRRRAS